MHLDDKRASTILDVGCGTGLLAIASQPFLNSGGKYIGIDVAKADIEFCQGHYPKSSFEFIHLETENAFYAPEQNREKLGWPIVNNSIEFVTALSVWTHFNEEDAAFYLKEVGRVLKPGSFTRCPKADGCLINQLTARPSFFTRSGQIFQSRL